MCVMRRNVSLSALNSRPATTSNGLASFSIIKQAEQRLKIVVPLTLLIIFVLIYFNTRSVVKTSIVLLAVPFSLIGAFWLLWLLGYHMSVAVWVGFACACRTRCRDRCRHAALPRSRLGEIPMPKGG